MRSQSSLLLLFLSVFFIYGTSVKGKERVIDRPQWLYLTSGDLEVKRVLLTDTATVVSFKVRCVYRPWSMRSSVHLTAGGTSYAYRSGKLLTSKDGVVTESAFYPDSTNRPVKTVIGDKSVYDKDSLVMCFDPLPADMPFFNFMEGDEQGSWQIYGIRIDGKPYPKVLPKQNRMSDMPLPAYTPNAGKTILKGRIYGYDQSIMKGNIGYIGNDYSLVGNPFDFDMSIDSLGYFRYESDLSHPIPFRCNLLGRAISTVLVPGETLEMDFDAVANAIDLSYMLSKPEEVIQFRGNTWAINEMMNYKFPDYAVYLSYIQGILHLSFDEYVADIWKRYQETIKEIADDPVLNIQQREFMKLRAQAYYLNNRISYLDMISNGLYFSNIKKDSIDFGKYEKPFTLKDPHSRELNVFDDLKALYVIYDVRLLDYMEANGLTGSPVYAWMTGLRKAKELSASINALQPVTDPAGWKGIDAQYLPGLRQLNDTILEKVKKMNQQESAGKIKEVPDVPADRLIQAIIDQYKGKVVLIDCWATWCGPCRTGISKMEPVKDELKGKDVIFVYLTNETSDATTWMKAIENMKGDHYRISNVKWKQLPNISAIPHYLLFDKEGKQVLDQVGWEDELIGTFKSAISKALGE